MKATHHKLNIVWKAVVRFTVAVRPARSVAQIVSRSHRRLMIGKRWLTLSGLPARDTTDGGVAWRSSSHCMNQ